MADLGKDTYEALVVGTGFGGAVTACRLAQAGVDVGVLERGARFELGGFPRVGSHIDEMSWHRGGPYDVRPLNDVLVVQAAGYGGGSLIYANVQMRPSADTFEDGWPAGYSRSALDPYYDLVAHMLDIRPVETDPATGDLPPKTRLMEEAAIRLGRGAQFFRPNLAVRFEGAGEAPTRNRFGALQSGCLHCGECDIGCNVGAKNTLDLNYLAAAELAGAEVATHAELTWLAPEGDGYRIRFRDREASAERSLHARHVFLCMGAVSTTEFLLRCRDQFQSLPRLSPTLGHGYSGNGDFLAFGLGATPPFAPTKGPTITTACVFDYDQDGRRLRFILEEGGVSPQGMRLLPLLHPVRLARLAAKDLEDRVAHHAHSFATLVEHEQDKTAVLLVMGRDQANGRIELTRSHHRLRVRWDTRSNLALYTAETAACRELVAALGGKLALSPNWRFLGQPSAVHNLGGCRMGAGPRDGVVDPNGDVFGYAGLHVHDGAILPAAVGVNPSHTIAAVAERCVEALIRRRVGSERWQAPETASASRPILPEDGISIPVGGTDPPAVAGGALYWRETMAGTSHSDGVSRTTRFDATISVPDVAAFVADPAHPGQATGRVVVDGLTEPAGSPIDGGSFHLFLEGDDPRERTMVYELPFHAVDGHPWLLRGVKRVRGHRIIDFWRATTTLNAEITPRGGAGPSSSGQLRLGVPEVLRMLVSMRSVGAARRADPLAALWKFVRFYAGTVLRLYVAGKRARGR